MRSDGAHRGFVTKAASRLKGELQDVDAAEHQTSAPRSSPAPTESRIGISCSGGGIRSAAYNLGALQILQDAGVLGRARYLSAVSGGSYIAGSFTMVARYSEPDLLEQQPPYAPGSPEEEYLRNRSSYLAAGLKGKARLMVRFMLGVGVNLLVVATVMLALGRPLGWLAAWVRPDELLRGLPEGAVPAAPDLAPLRTVMVILFLVGLLLALSAVMRSYTRAAQRRIAWLAGGTLAVGIVLWIAMAALPFSVIWLRRLLAAPSQLFGSEAGVGDWEQNYAAVNALLSTLGALGVLSLVAGVARVWMARNRSQLALLAGAVVAPVALVAALLVVVNTASANGLLDHQQGTIRLSEVAWFAGAVVAMIILYLGSDLTAWSLHPFYKRRLSSAFAVRRVRGPDGEPTAEALEADDLATLSDTTPRGGDWPELLVCAAANISDEGATPPGRSATTFTFSSAEVGGPLVGYVDTQTFEAALGAKRRADITLPAAIAVSGAAVSPSMGRLSRPSWRFLLTLANARLGVWLPNPRGIPTNEGDTSQLDGWPSRPRLSWLVREMLGLNRLNARYLYVTDGGHYENLGLVELLRRECTEIYCFDASGDQVDTFFTLGLAVALARSELGVEILIDPSEITDDEDPQWCATDHVIGTIRYRNGATGTLLFAKAGVTRDAPWDVRAYNEKDPEFPTHATTDQLYTDEKFEAYRALGRHTAARALRSMASYAQQELIDAPASDPVTSTGTPAMAPDGSVPTARVPSAAAPPQTLD